MAGISRKHGVSRRELALAPLAAVPAPRPAAAQTAAPQSGEPLVPLNRFGRMVQEYFVHAVRGAEQKSLARKRALRTRSDAERYLRETRAAIRRCFGPLPERTPLHPRVTGTLERDGYRVEKILFESRPGFWVTSNLYVPSGRRFPLPGIVGSCGHSANGKAHADYQSFGQGLVKLGYVTLIFDPVGQGERLQYPGPDGASRIPGNPVYEHLLAGNQQVLVGEWLGAWRVWDGIRALDYLLTRPEVDPQRVGVTGTSGGGTLSTWLCAMDDRWTMAAPSCFITTFRRNLENELPADPEQYPPAALALGLDHDDFLAALAPKPVAILANEKDFFDVRGAVESFERLKNLYRLLGKPENIHIDISPTYHGFTKPNREAMYHWMNRAAGLPAVGSEPAVTIEKDEALWCTPNGRVDELGSRTVADFTAAKSRSLAGTRRSLSATELARTIAGSLRIPARTGVPDFRVLRPLTNRRYPKPHCANYAVETEPGIHCIVYLLSEDPLVSRPPAGRRAAILYVSHQSADEELREEPLIGQLLSAEPGSAFYACDVRGIGESRPNTCAVDAYAPYGADYMYAGYSIMLDAPYCGRRTFDVLRILDWLKASGHAEVHLAARGWGSLPATFAAILAPAVSRITLKHAPASYSEIAQTEMYRWPLSALVPNALARFDLPNCYQTLEARPLRRIEPWGARDAT